MSIVVVGGNDRMATRYKDICKSFKCKAKVFTQMPADFENKLGTPILWWFLLIPVLIKWFKE